MLDVRSQSRTSDTTDGAKKDIFKIGPPRNGKIANPSIPASADTAAGSPPPSIQQSTNPSSISDSTPDTRHSPSATLDPRSFPVPSIENSDRPLEALSEIQNPKSKIQNGEEACYDCGAPLPPLLPTGQRPRTACVACGAKLYPPDTKFDHCYFCQAAQPILASGERPSPACSRCKNALAPPGQQFVTHCPACGIELPPLTTEGLRISDRCPECRAIIPLLEPAVAPAIVTRVE